VRQQVGLEHQQRERQEARAGAEHFAGGEERHQQQSQREQGRGRARARQNHVRVVAVEELPAIRKCLGLEEAIPQRRDVQLQGQQRRGRHQFDERRMLGVQTEIASHPGHIAGEDMVALIPGLRSPPHR
jgi:hypothetical protein